MWADQVRLKKVLVNWFMSTLYQCCCSGVIIDQLVTEPNVTNKHKESEGQVGNTVNDLKSICWSKLAMQMSYLRW